MVEAFPWTFPVNFGTDVPPVVPGSNTFVSVWINGVEIDKVISTEIERGVSKRFDRCTIVIANPGGSRTGTYQPNQDVEIVTWDAAVLFAGRLVSSRPTEKQRIEVKADDYSVKLIDRQVDKTYDAVAITTIIQDLIDTYYSDITYTNVATIAKTVSARFNNISVQDCLIYLADIAYTNGADFYIDENKDLHFYESQTRDSGITLRNAPYPANLTQWDFPEEANAIYNKVTGSGNFYPFTYTAEDATSQTSYGLREMPLLIEQRARTLQDVIDKVDRTLLRYKEPYRTGILTVKASTAQDVRPGELVNVDISTSGISSGSYMVTGMTITYPNQKAKVRVSEWHTDLMDVWAELIKEIRRTSFRAIEDWTRPEEYINHNGVVDNFMETVVVGSGTATTNATTHTMELAGNGTGGNYAIYKTKKSWALSEYPLVISFLVNGISANPVFYFGMSDNWASPTGLTSNTIMVYALADGTNVLHVNKSGEGHTASFFFPLVASGDIVTFILTSNRCMLYVNIILVAETDPANSNHIPTAEMTVGAEGWGSHTIGIDMVNIKVFQ